MIFLMKVIRWRSAKERKKKEKKLWPYGVLIFFWCGWKIANRKIYFYELYCHSLLLSLNIKMTIECAKGNFRLIQFNNLQNKLHIFFGNFKTINHLFISRIVCIFFDFLISWYNLRNKVFSLFFLYFFIFTCCFILNA